METLQEIINEAELLDLFGIRKEALNTLRYNGLPYCKISSRCRMYIVKDILSYIENRRFQVSSDE